MVSRRAIAALLALAAVAGAGATASGDAGGKPATATSTAYARQDGGGPRSDFVTVNGDGEDAGDTTRVRAGTSGGRGVAAAGVSLEDVDIFDGLVTAQRVSVSAQANADGTSTSGSVSGLAIDGKPADPPAGRTVYDLGGYGWMVALDSGATGVLGLRAYLTRPYKTHKAGEVVRVAYASAKASNAVRPRAAPKKAKQAKKKRAHKAAKKRKHPQLTGKQKLERALTADDRYRAAVLLARPGYTFPVAGKHDFADTYGAPRSDVPVHIGNDIFAAFGTPIVAVADGRIYRVGTLKISGNRLWLRDHEGNRYFYAHLSDFAAAAYNGADVHAGEIIGFVGNTGDAEPTPPHLHFEVHLPNGASLDPYAYLRKWDASGVGTAKWLRRYGKDPGVRPGALVVVRDFLARP